MAERVFYRIDPSIRFKIYFNDSQNISMGNKLAELKGNSISLLMGERTALNFLQRMSGIATETQKFVKAMEGVRTRIMDTRKTSPGLRMFEKYAVKMGGGKNHRLSLSDMVLIKDNHLKIAGGISKAVRTIKKKIGAGIKIEVETSSLNEVKQFMEKTH